MLSIPEESQSALTNPMNHPSPALTEYLIEKRTRQLVTLASVLLALVSILAARLAYLATN